MLQNCTHLNARAHRGGRSIRSGGSVVAGGPPRSLGVVVVAVVWCLHPFLCKSCNL